MEQILQANAVNSFVSEAMNLLSSNGMLITPKKKMLIQELSLLKSSFDAETFYLNMRNRNVAVCRATVNNLISLLSRYGLLATVIDESKRAKSFRVVMDNTSHYYYS